MRVEAPFLPGPLWMRAGTSDLETFAELVIGRSYRHPVLDSLYPQNVVDAGANAGFSTVLLALMFPNAHVLALEPAASNFALLVKNTALLANVETVRAALWDKETMVCVTNPGAEPWAYRFREGAAGSESVTTLTIKGLLRRLRCSEIDLLKVDIEGAEKRVFSGSCSEWPNSVRVLIIELHDRIEPGCGYAVYGSAVKRFFQKYQSGDMDILVFG